jgi:hypothetical protein
MEEKIFLGRDQNMLEVPASTWKQHLTQIPQHSQSRLSFMTETHHQIRYFVVKELANQQKPIAPEFIAEELNIPLEQLKFLLEELERKLFFLVRNEEGAVAWAYPVTVETTSHQMNFSSGERLYGAWAEDVIASPFVQGQLRKEYVSIEVETKCSHCDRVMHLTIDSDMRVSVREQDAHPLVFMPDIDWNNFAERTIIDSYWRNSIFFWSEEHAREYRASRKQVNGVYLTLEQCAYMTPITQGALFDFK